MDGHLSSCALHNAPAMEPGPCSCGKDSPATPEQHALVAEAIKARIGNVIPLPVNEPGSAFDKAMREKLAQIEQAQQADA